MSSGIYFPNLNSIRFIAALMVIVHHVEQIKHAFHIPNAWEHPVIHLTGRLGVVLFFVLSGFLITFLLLTEQKETSTIHIGKFYMRRILRIWPLYFLIVFLALYIFPQINFLHIPVPGAEVKMPGPYLHIMTVLYVLFLPNLVISAYGVLPFASHTWSIGTEEQFYLIWPVGMKYIPNKWLFFTGVIVFYLLVKHALPPFIDVNSYSRAFFRFWNYMPIDCMAIGGLFALLMYSKETLPGQVKTLLFDRRTQWISLIITLALMFTGTEIPYINYEVYSILFGILICNLAMNDRRIFSLEFPLLDYLGRISYGLYIYHPLIIVTCVELCLTLDCANNFFIYINSIVITIGVAAFSYKYFESWFIRKKERFTQIGSGSSKL